MRVQNYWDMMQKQSRAGSAQEKADYIRHHSGTALIIQDFREQQYANVKVSSNDGWYSDLYKKRGKKPTIRDAEDAAYEEAYPKPTPPEIRNGRKRSKRPKKDATSSTACGASSNPSTPKTWRRGRPSRRKPTTESTSRR